MNDASAIDSCLLTILMPCLNEAETIERCIRNAQSFLQAQAIDGEVLISDNGSTDGSIELARRAGARVVHAPVRGYGGALMHGIRNAHGRYVIMGDADDSYDFSRLDVFLRELEAGADLVMGNRFGGGIAEGAMPFLHRYLGNPALSFIGRLFFRIPIGDFHCGLRGFRRQAMLSLGLSTTGMEFASEMVVKSAVNGLVVREVPTTLNKDGRSRPPHLRTWRDGWRHLRFLLIYSPRWLFLYPGVIAFLAGLLVVVTVLPGPVMLPWGPELDIHSLIVGCLLMLTGAQAIGFAFLARRYAASQGLLPDTPLLGRFDPFRSLEGVLGVCLLLVLGGTFGLGHALAVWQQAGFGHLPYASLAKQLVVSSGVLALAAQLAFSGFLAAILGVRTEACAK